MPDHSTITVYRIEHKKTRLGPFWLGEISEYRHPYSMPTLYDEPDLDRFFKIGNTGRNRYVFAFNSIHTLHYWFNLKLRHVLTTKGYILAIYSVKRHPKAIAVAESQAIFIRKYATLIEDCPLVQGVTMRRKEQG